MNSSQINRATIGILATLVAAGGGVALHQANRADAADQRAAAWRAEAAGWQSLAREAVQSSPRTASSRALTTNTPTVVEAAVPIAQPIPATPPTSKAS